MKHTYLALSLALVLAGCDHREPPKTAKEVSVNRYMGTWYELASLPTSFQRGCYCTKANYEWKDHWMQVTNTCLKGEKPGKLKKATAKAWPISDSLNTKFKMQFFKPFKGDYWILYVDKNYQHAIAGTPDYEHIWFLSRKPTTTVGEFLKLKAIAKAKGYGVDALIMTNQSCNKRKTKPE